MVLEVIRSGTTSLEMSTYRQILFHDKIVTNLALDMGVQTTSIKEAALDLPTAIRLRAPQLLVAAVLVHVIVDSVPLQRL
jgi:hypothetical protein